MKKMVINFVTPEEVKDLTELPKNIENSQLEESISFAQDEHIKYILGDALYDELSEQLYDGSITDANKALQDELKLTLSYYTHYEAMPFIVFQTRKSGLISRVGDDSTTVNDTESVEYYRIAIRKRAIKFQNGLIKFLNENEDDYPLWESKYKSTDLYKDKNGIYFY